MRRLLKAPRATAGLIIAAFAVLIAVRLPNVILEGGRFWAEEGTFYFHTNWYVPWYQGWFAFHNGYINLIAGFATWAALKLGGIAYAPAITVLIALIVQCLPVIIIITHDFPWRRAVSLTGLAVLMCALPPLTSEVWLNTINSQFHFSLCAALIFASPSTTLALFVTDCVILALGALSAFATCLMFPLFALAAVINRSRAAITYAAITGAGFLLQITLYLLHDTSLRGGRLSPDAVLSIISLHTIILQFGGLHLATIFSDYLAAAHAENHVLWAGCAIFLIFYGTLALITVRLENSILFRLTAACVLISLISFYEAFEGDFSHFMVLQFGERYSYVPMVINGLLITGLASAGRRPLNQIFLALLCLMIFIGAKEYRRDAMEFDNGPNWLAQIPAWRQKTEGVVNVWPDKTWPMRLTANHHLSKRDQL